MERARIFGLWRRRRAEKQLWYHDSLFGRRRAWCWPRSMRKNGQPIIEASVDWQSIDANGSPSISGAPLPGSSYRLHGTQPFTL